jgi:hypothetical protein
MISLLRNPTELILNLNRLQVFILNIFRKKSRKEIIMTVDLFMEVGNRQIKEDLK